MTETPDTTTPRPDQTFAGMILAGGLAYLAYLLNQAIAAKLPIPVLANNASLADKLSALIRTVIIALTTGAVMVFGTIAIGLLLLTIKYSLKSWLGKTVE
jgi:hypothetical protein